MRLFTWFDNYTATDHPTTITPRRGDRRRTSPVPPSPTRADWLAAEREYDKRARKADRQGDDYRSVHLRNLAEQCRDAADGRAVGRADRRSSVARRRR